MSRNGPPFIMSSLALVLVAALADVSRPDWQIIVLTLAIFAVLMFVLRVQPIEWRKVALASALCLCSMQVANYALTAFNWTAYGIDGPANYLDHRYSNFFSTIAALPSDHPTDRYYLGDQTRRELAYSLSPTMAGLRDRLELRSGNGSIGFDASLKFFGKDDIANAFYYWHIDNTMGMPARDYFKLLEKATQEVRSAAFIANIKLKFPYLSVISPDLKIWIGYLPSSILRVYQLAFHVSTYENVDKNQESQELINSYNIATLRRVSLVSIVEGNKDSHSFLSSLFRKAYLIIPFLFPFAVAICSFSIFVDKHKFAWKTIYMLLFSLFLSRWSFYSLLDAAFYTASPWYLVPNHVVVMLMLACGVPAGMTLYQRRSTGLM